MANRRLYLQSVSVTFMLGLSLCISASGQEPTSGQGEPPKDAVRVAAERALGLLTTAANGSAENRKCFTCHGQAMPVIALAEASRHGIDIDRECFDRQVLHAHSHLKRGRKSYLEGKGQGGGVDTSGYALWALDEAQHPADEVTRFVTDWMLEKQRDSGKWKCSSDRPPSETSDFTTSYLALRGIEHFVDGDRAEQAAQALKLAQQWIEQATPEDTEDRVFRLLSLRYLGVGDKMIKDSISQLMRAQREDGGWSQLDSMESDPYATASVMYALSETGMASDDPAWRAGLDYLLQSQHSDGSWHVVSRSKPFQEYFETGFPHGKDQFISTTATAWATVVLIRSL